MELLISAKCVGNITTFFGFLDFKAISYNAILALICDTPIDLLVMGDSIVYIFRYYLLIWTTGRFVT